MPSPKSLRNILILFAFLLFYGCGGKETAPRVTEEYVVEKNIPAGETPSARQSPQRNTESPSIQTKPVFTGESPGKTPPSATGRETENVVGQVLPSAAASKKTTAGAKSPKLFKSEIIKPAFLYLEEGQVALSFEMSFENPHDSILLLNEARFVVRAGAKTFRFKKDLSEAVAPGQTGKALFERMVLFDTNPLKESFSNVKIRAEIIGRQSKSATRRDLGLKSPLVEVELSGSEKDLYLVLKHRIRITNPNPFAITLASFAVLGEVGRADVSEINYELDRSIGPNEVAAFEHVQRIDMPEVYQNALDLLYQEPVRVDVTDNFVFPFFAVSQKIRREIRLKPYLRPFSISLVAHEAHSD